MARAETAISELLVGATIGDGSRQRLLDSLPHSGDRRGVCRPRCAIGRLESGPTFGTTTTRFAGIGEIDSRDTVTNERHLR